MTASAADQTSNLSSIVIMSLPDRNGILPTPYRPEG
jgi:hypothetical protein